MEKSRTSNTYFSVDSNENIIVPSKLQSLFQKFGHVMWEGTKEYPVVAFDSSWLKNMLTENERVLSQYFYKPIYYDNINVFRSKEVVFKMGSNKRTVHKSDRNLKRAGKWFGVKEQSTSWKRMGLWDEFLRSCIQHFPLIFHQVSTETLVKGLSTWEICSRERTSLVKFIY